MNLRSRLVVLSNGQLLLLLNLLILELLKQELVWSLIRNGIRCIT